MVQMGTYEELLSSSAAFARLLEDINQYQKEQKPDQKPQITTLQSRISRISTATTDPGTGEEEIDVESILSDTENKQQGTVKWDVYISFLQAGIGVVFGILLVFVLMFAHQSLHMHSSHWLAEWSNDENYRINIKTNCSNIFNEKIEAIRSMTKSEWEAHRADKFYGYLVLTILVVLFASFRVSITRLICLNAARVLHNK